MTKISEPEELKISITQDWEFTTNFNKINKETFQSTESHRTGFFWDSCVPNTTSDKLNVTYYIYHKTNKDVIGFVSISAHRITLKAIPLIDQPITSYLSTERTPSKKGEKVYNTFLPAAKIDQIAISQPYQKQGYGTQILGLIIKLIRDLSKQIGMRLIYALIIDNPSNRKLFIDKYHFREIHLSHWKSDDPNRPSKTRKSYSDDTVKYPVKPVYMDIL